MGIYVEEAGLSMNRENMMLYKQVVNLELALLACDEMGIEVESIESSGLGNYRLRARDNAVTQQLLRQRKAFNYGMEVQNGRRVYLNHAIIRNVKVVWSSTDYRH